MAGDMKALVDKLMGSDPYGAKIAARQAGDRPNDQMSSLRPTVKKVTITTTDHLGEVNTIIVPAIDVKMMTITTTVGGVINTITTAIDLNISSTSSELNNPSQTDSTSSTGGNNSSHDTSTDMKQSGSTKGLSVGAIAGIAVGIALLAILVGAGIFLFLRRRKDQQKHAGDQAEDGTIRKGKQPAGETGSSDVVDSPSTPYPSQETPVPVLPPQPSHTPQQHPPMDQAGPSQIINYRSGSPAIVQPSTTSIHDDGRVSPPLPDDMPDGHPDANLHGSSRDLALIATGGGAGSAAEEDPEMQWILEEERRAKERKEHQEELRRPR